MSKVRIKFENNEIEVEGTDSFIQKQLKDYFDRLGKNNFDVTVPIIKKNGSKPATIQSDRVPAPAEFYRKYGKDDGLSQVLIFGKYLELYCDKPEFARKDVNEISSKAKLPDIHSQYFTRAVKIGYLNSNNKLYSITSTGDKYLDGKEG
jgi:hypothetical protein